MIRMNTGTRLTLNCLVARCKEQIVHTDEDIAIALFNAHINTHTVGASRNVGSDCKKRKKLTELKINKGMSMDSWKSFQVLWRLYRHDADLSKADCSLQLMYCCSEEVRGQLFRVDPTITARPEIEQLKSIRKLAVTKSAGEVRCSKMLNMSQRMREWPRMLLEEEQGGGAMYRREDPKTIKPTKVPPKPHQKGRQRAAKCQSAKVPKCRQDAAKGAAKMPPSRS